MSQNKAVAARALQNNKSPWSGAAALIAALFLFSVPTMAQEAAPSPVFQNAKPKTPACRIISRGPGAKLDPNDPALVSFLDGILGHLRDEKVSGFKDYFHPRLRGKGDQLGDRVFANLKASYAKPWQFSVYRVWALEAPEGDKVTVPCSDDQVVLSTRYGYPHQVGVWLQVMGQDELGRIFIAAAPREGKWTIVGWHFQQWTQNGRDYEAWVKRGQAALKEKDTIHAYMAFDVAQKMLFGGEFVAFPIKGEILAARDQIMTKDKWLELARQELTSPEEVYVGTILAEDGVGILLRERIFKEYATPELQKRCLAKGKKLLEKGWLKAGDGGLRCEYIGPREDTQVEGKLGGLYYSRQDLMRKQL